MAFTVARSTTEILRLTRYGWLDSSYIHGFMADTSAAGTPPTEDSSVATWLTYALGNPFSYTYPSPSTYITSTDFSYNTLSQRAETVIETFNFTNYIAGQFSTFSSTTLTHVVFADIRGIDVSTSQPPFAVLTETTPITLTSSTSLSYGVRLFGKAA